MEAVKCDLCGNLVPLMRRARGGGFWYYCAECSQLRNIFPKAVEKFLAKYLPREITESDLSKEELQWLKNKEEKARKKQEEKKRKQQEKKELKKSSSSAPEETLEHVH